MAKDNIVAKLNDFLTSHVEITEEAHAVYIMVELRKILDYDKNTGSNAFKILRFYADWTVHVSKDQIGPEMKLMIDEMLTDIKKCQLQNPVMVSAGGPATRFGYMESLRSELREFLANNGIDLTLVDSGWLAFIAKFIKVLDEQPIINPHPEIQSIYFKPAAERCVTFVIIFSHPINGYDYYEYGNAF